MQKKKIVQFSCKRAGKQLFLTDFPRTHNEAHVYEQPFSRLQICTGLTFYLIKATATHLLLIRLDQDQTQPNKFSPVCSNSACLLHVCNIYVRYKVTVS